MKYVYQVIFEDDDGKIGVSVPNIPGCFTFGDDMPEAIAMAEDAIAMVLASKEDDKEPIPAPSKITDIKTNGTISLVLADTDEWRKQFDNKAVKKTSSIPTWLNKKAEAAGINFSQVLQDALKNAIA